VGHGLVGKLAPASVDRRANERMKFSAAELAEIRWAFRQRIDAEPVRKQPVRRKPKPEPLPTLVREPVYEGGEVVLRPAEVAEFFEVTTRTVRRWADSGLLPSFRTIGGQRRFRWGDGDICARATLESVYALLR
jgi:excisionase family DNA binding protein